MAQPEHCCGLLPSSGAVAWLPEACVQQRGLAGSGSAECGEQPRCNQAGGTPCGLGISGQLDDGAAAMQRKCT